LSAFFIFKKLSREKYEYANIERETLLMDTPAVICLYIGLSFLKAFRYIGGH